MNDNYLMLEFIRLWGQGEALEESRKHRDYDTDEVIDVCRKWADEYEHKMDLYGNVDAYDFFQEKFEAID